MNSIISHCSNRLIYITKCVIRSNISNKLVQTSRNFCSSGQEQKITVGNQVINYLKVGHGKHAVLCFPGALGTIWSDFKPQIEKLDKEVFTVVAFDPPGYGFSRPPNREFSLDFYKKDATIAYQLMQNLGIPKFSLLGWSDGGNSSLILAAQYPQAVEKLVVWGANSYILPGDIDAFEAIRDTNKWSEKARTPLIALYGAEGLQKMWNDWCDTMQAIQKQNGGNVCMDAVSKISSNCPTLILHGTKDPVVRPEHPNYLNTHIRNARMHIFPNGKHNIHLRYADQFNAVVTEFILEKE